MKAYVGQTRSRALTVELEQHGIGECVVCWVQLAHAHDLRCHIGRLGPAHRVHWARNLGCDSIEYPELEILDLISTTSLSGAQPMSRRQHGDFDPDQALSCYLAESELDFS